MKKNVASQVIGAQMVAAADGSEFTGAVTVEITGDGGTQGTGSVGGGACTHEGHGYHTYTPDQSETNFDLVAFTFHGTGAITATVQIYTDFPQTGDNFARLGAPAGASVSADIAAVKSNTSAILVDTGTTLDQRIPAALVGGKMDSNVGTIDTDAITAASLATDAGEEIADALLDRNMATGTDSGSSTVRTPRQAFRHIRNRWLLSTSNALTVYKEDDSTTSWTSVVTGSTSASPIIESNPAGP